jgi:hypothetical protein
VKDANLLQSTDLLFSVFKDKDTFVSRKLSREVPTANQPDFEAFA